MGAEREPFHLGKIASALLWRHRLADGNKMLEHLRLASRPQRGDFTQLGLRLGGEIGAIAEDGCKFTFLRGDLCTQLGALRQITFMQLADMGQLCGAQMEFRAQPVQIVGGTRHAALADVAAQQTGTAENRRAQRQRAEEKDKRTVHINGSGTGVSPVSSC